MDNTLRYWNLDRESILQKFQTTVDGISSSEASIRIGKYGRNVVGEKKPRTFLHIFVGQMKNWLVVTLIGASILSFILGQGFDGIVIIALVMLSVFFGFIQEYKAEKTINSLKKFIKNKSMVLRDGKWVEVDSSKLVPGDIVTLSIGDKVPADVRLIESDNFCVDEAVLTGESIPVLKNTKFYSMSTLIPSKIKNTAFMGTSCSTGKAIGVVVMTGKDTFFGKTAKILEDKEPQTDFQKQLNSFSLFLFRVIMVMTVFIFVSNTALHKGILESFLFALALAVGITPEMLPAIITVTLSRGAIKMAQKKVIVKKLASVEDLGNIDTLCMDKTGTLTNGIFSFSKYEDFDGLGDERLLIKGALCVGGIMDKSQSISKNPIDKAIWDSIYVQRIKSKLNNYRFLDENEFDYERRRMSVLIRHSDESLLVVKGAIETVIPICNNYLTSGVSKKITDVIKKNVLNKVKDYEDEGYRVIGIAQRNLFAQKSSQQDECDLTFLGYFLFKDPIKPDAKVTIQNLIKLGISLKVISGDSLIITTNIAHEAGIVFNNNEVVTGEYLDGLGESQFSEIARKAKIFARVTPVQKYKIVQALNYEGHIVGFMGDGVNDAPALKASDVGISVESGAQIAKDASDIVLLEKDLGVLGDGIVVGRKTFGNIMKYILNTISANYGNMFTVAISSLFLKFIPLLPSQILLNNFISDIPLFAVATDNVDPDFVLKPKKWNLGFIKNFMIYYGFVSTFFDLVLILPMVFIFNVSPEVFRTAWFIESSISEMIVTFTIRTKMPFYKSRPSNWLLGLSVASIFVVLMLPMLPWKAFSFTPLPYFVWALILFDLISYFIVTELVKSRFFAKFES